MAVKFSPFNLLFSYIDEEVNKKGIWETYALDRARFSKRIKEFEMKYINMNSLQELLETFMKPNLTTVVLGNVGRRPSLLIYYFNLLFRDLKIIIRSRWEDELETSCDVLVWLEPEFNSPITKPHYAKSMIVFTSHLQLVNCTHVVGYYLGHSYYDSIMLKRMEPIPSGNIVKLKDYVILKPLPFQTTYEIIPKDSNVIIDLTHCRDSHEQYICFMNSFEVLNYFNSHVMSWKLCLNSIKQFQDDMVVCKEKIEKAKLTACYEKLCLYHGLK